MKIANELYQSAHLLLHLGEDGSPIYADEFRQLNTKVTQCLNELYPIHGSSSEEEAGICVSLLMGFLATIYNVEEQDEKIQRVLDRAYVVLQELKPSLLKCRLLICCYAEVQDKVLMEEAKEIIMSWGGRELTTEEKEMMERYNILITDK